MASVRGRRRVFVGGCWGGTAGANAAVTGAAESFRLIFFRAHVHGVCRWSSLRLQSIVPDSAPRCAEPQSAQTAVAAATTSSTHTLPPHHHLRAATSRRGNLAPRENRSASGTTPGSAGRTCVLSAAARGTGDGTASHTVSHSRRRRACPHPRRAALAQQPCRGGALALRPQPRKMAVRTYDRWPLACGAATRARVGAQWPISGRACSRGAPRRVFLGCVAAGGRVWE